MQYFTKMTSRVSVKGKKSAVVMGRKTWESIPPKYRPLCNRINYVLTSSKTNIRFPGAIILPSLDEVIKDFEGKGDAVDKLWAIGGSSVYKEALQSPYFYRAYITRIKKDFECDTFLPQLPAGLQHVTDPDVSTEEQEEGGLKYIFEVLEKPSTGSAE